MSQFQETSHGCLERKKVLSQDPHISHEGRAEIYKALSNQGVHFQWHEFNNAHAFLRDEGYPWDPAATQISYSMILELFKRKLSEGNVQNSSSSE